MKTQRCSAPRCGAPIIWCLTASAKKMPIDAGISPEGAWRIEGPEASPVATYVPVGERAAARDLHTTHWATCSSAKAFKKPKEQSELPGV
jgi:hypothetical protein